MGYIKIILIGLTIILLAVKIVRQKQPTKSNINFHITSFFLTLAIYLIIVFKLHHLLRAEFKISNTIMYLSAAVFFTFYLYKFIGVLKKNKFPLFVASIISFVLALALDLLTDAKILYFSSSDFIEEILRILGALFWLLYFTLYNFKTESK